MLKNIVAATLAASLIGSAGTVAAAANPFSDVPEGHWAYDAIDRLAARGIIEGYGDGSYRGENEITRYEMAQLVARAMADGRKDADVDRLAAEFAAELNSLGIRVAALEKKTDNVRIYGVGLYSTRRVDVKDKKTGEKTHADRTKFGFGHTDKHLQLRLKVAAKVNKHWTAKAALYVNDDTNNAKSSANMDIGHVEYMYAQGDFGRTTVCIGQYENYETVTRGMIWDHNFSGVKVAYNGGDLKTTLQAGRANDNSYFGGDASTASDVYGVTFDYETKKLTAGAGYYEFRHSPAMKPFNGLDKYRIWAVSFGYKFDKNWRLYTTYAENAALDKSRFSRSRARGYNIQLDYKGFDLQRPGAWGAHIAYKHTGNAVVTYACTYDFVYPGTKGIELEYDLTLARNMLFNLGYFTGKTVDSSLADVDVIYSRLHFYF